MHPMLNIAIRAARKAGDLITRYTERLDLVEVQHKSRHNPVTEVDTKAEQVIIDTIRKHYPNHGILAEESGHQNGDDFLWIIDPLDGTTNFVHGYPQISVSIALQYKGEIDQAVVYDPLRQELFTASKGQGAQLNNHRIRISPHKQLDGALLGSGYPTYEPKFRSAYLNMLGEILPHIGGMRRSGSAVLDLAYIAAGRLDGYWELGLQPWDFAAGSLLIQEAGGVVTDFSGGDDFLKKGELIAANVKIHPELMKIVAQHHVTS